MDGLIEDGFAPRHSGRPDLHPDAPIEGFGTGRQPTPEEAAAAAEADQAAKTRRAEAEAAEQAARSAVAKA